MRQHDGTIPAGLRAMHLRWFAIICLLTLGACLDFDCGGTDTTCTCEMNCACSYSDDDKNAAYGCFLNCTRPDAGADAGAADVELDADTLDAELDASLDAARADAACVNASDCPAMGCNPADPDCIAACPCGQDAGETDR